MIEPERAIADVAVLTFMRDNRFAAADFTIRRDGVCRRSPQLVRMVAALVPKGDTSANPALWPS